MANENVTANIGFEKDIRIDFNVYGMHIIQENSTLSEENPHVCIGWSGLGDLSAINTKQELDDLYKLKNPSDSNQRKGANVSQIWMFIDTMKIGDYVVYFDGSTAHFGKVIGNYEYIEDMPNQSSDYVNNRKVEWIKDIAYNDLPKEYRNLYTYRSIFKLDTYKPLIEDILNGNEMVKDEFDDYEEELLLDYTIDELVELLKNLINKYSKKVVTIHLFGIKYGKLIRKKRYNAKEIINKAGLNDSYITELNKGISLSEFIDVVDNNKLICLDRELNNVENNDKKSFDYLSSTIKGGENLIVYGAPGCGKSFYVDYDKLGKNKSIGEYEGEFEKENIIRTTFFQDYTNTDFVGQILPIITHNKETNKDDVTYKFNPGPFTLALNRAIQNPNKKVALVIEELNRGNAASIFGDIFQLLDRKDGVSVYNITNVNIQKYLSDENEMYKFDNIRIPSNMFIYTTMNTSDQNVFTLDTAFKRRWNFEKIKNTFLANHPYKDYYIPVMDITWEEFSTSINKAIVNTEDFLNSEDKQLGVFFVDKKCLREKSSAVSNLEKRKEFAYKVFEYLWDDVTKYDHTILFNANFKTLDDVIDAYVNY